MTAAPKREWAAYVRVSKVNGREGDSFASPQQQETVIRAALGLKHDATVADDQVYVDLDRTGRDGNRPAFKEMLAWVRESPSTRGVAVMDGTRLFRDAAEFLSITRDLERLGAEYLSVHEAMDAKTPEGRLMHTFMAGIGEYQSASIGRRWRMTQRGRVESGLPSGGPVRFGYRQEPGQRVQSPDPARGPVLAGMYDDFVAGRGAQAIARRLNEAGVVTERGNVWGTTSVLRTLDSGFGAGKILIHVREPLPDGRFEVKTEYRDGAHDAVITPELWETYLRVRAARRVKPARHKSPRWHLAGLAKCGLCGTNLRVASYRDARTLVTCSRYTATRTCSGVWMSKRRLDQMVFWWLGTRLDELARHAGLARSRDRARARAQGRAERAKARLDKLTREKVGTARLRAAGDLTVPEYDEAKRLNRADTEAAERDLREAQDEAERLAPVEDVYETLVRFGESAGFPPVPDGDGAVLATDEYDAATDPTAPAVYNALLTKVIDRVEVFKEQVVIYPVIGKPHDISRL